jgi:hypothetical protein
MDGFRSKRKTSQYWFGILNELPHRCERETKRLLMKMGSDNPRIAGDHAWTFIPQKPIGSD